MNQTTYHTSKSEVPDFHLPNNAAPFPSQADMLKYLHRYAYNFDLNQHVRLHHLVIRVRPMVKDRWEIIVHDLTNDKFVVTTYDAVFVCNGHSSKPSIPNIVGADAFKLLHSRDFHSAVE